MYIYIYEIYIYIYEYIPTHTHTALYSWLITSFHAQSTNFLLPARIRFCQGFSLVEVLSGQYLAIEPRLSDDPVHSGTNTLKFQREDLATGALSE